MHYGADLQPGQRSARPTPPQTARWPTTSASTSGKNGGLQIVYNDTTNEFDGAGLYSTRQVAGSTITGGSVSDAVQGNPRPTPRRRPVPALALPAGPGSSSRSST